MINGPTYTRRQREEYKAHVEITCEELGITLFQYNIFKRLGSQLKALYEQQATELGWEEEKRLDIEEETIEEKANKLASKYNLHIYIRTGHKHEVIYLSKSPITDYSEQTCSSIY